MHDTNAPLHVNVISGGAAAAFAESIIHSIGNCVPSPRYSKNQDTRPTYNKLY